MNWWIVILMIALLLFGFGCGYLYSYNLVKMEVTLQCNSFLEANCYGYGITTPIWNWTDTIGRLT